MPSIHGLVVERLGNLLGRLVAPMREVQRLPRLVVLWRRLPPLGPDEVGDVILSEQGAVGYEEGIGLLGDILDGGDLAGLGPGDELSSSVLRQRNGFVPSPQLFYQAGLCVSAPFRLGPVNRRRLVRNAV